MMLSCDRPVIGTVWQAAAVSSSRSATKDLDFITGLRHGLDIPGLTVCNKNEQYAGELSVGAELRPCSLASPYLPSARSLRSSRAMHCWARGRLPASFVSM